MMEMKLAYVIKVIFDPTMSMKGVKAIEPKLQELADALRDDFKSYPFISVKSRREFIQFRK